MAAAGGSNIAIYGAIIANTCIAIGKFMGAFFTGSSAMMAEGIHSLVDTGNGLLLLLGIKRSKQKPDKLHPFGYGKEIYFWSFVVSMLIFAVGGGFAIYEGIHALQDPEVIEDPTWSYAVLFAAILFEGGALYVALKTFKKSRKESAGLYRSIVQSKDSATFAVIIEDSAALTGLIIAILGIFLSQTLNNPYFDGGASVLIGIVLLCVAIFLAKESKGLLLGESADEDVIKATENVLDANDKVNKWNLPNTMHFGPDSILMTVEVDLRDGLSMMEAQATIAQLRKDIRKAQPKITKIFIHSTDLDNDAPENGKSGFKELKEGI